MSCKESSLHCDECNEHMHDGNPTYCEKCVMELDTRIEDLGIEVERLKVELEEKA